MGLFSFFNKKKEPSKADVTSKITKKIVYKEEEFDVGKTSINIVFVNGEHFEITVYGSIDQSIYIGSEYNSLDSEPKVWPPFIRTSVLEAGYKLDSLDGSRPMNYTNNRECPTKIIYNTYYSASIIKTEPHLVKFKVAYLEENSNEKV
jgi:hypothetical protein